VAFVPDKRPHLIHLRLCFPSALQVPGHLGRIQRAQHSGVHRLQHSFFLLEFPQHGVGTDMQGARRITHPTGIETHVDDRLFDVRQAPTVAIVEEKTSPDTEGILAEVALGAPRCFAAFDDLVTLTVRAADRDERHGPFLPKRDYEDEAQCDSNLSLSPLLKHYRKFKRPFPPAPPWRPPSAAPFPAAPLERAPPWSALGSPCPREPPHAASVRQRLASSVGRQQATGRLARRTAAARQDGL